MSTALSSRLAWPLAVLLSLAAAYAAVEATRLYGERNYGEVLANEANRRALEITAATLNGNVMGSVAALGLLSQPIKSAARGEIPLQDPVVMEALRAVGEAYQANGVYVVNSRGIIQSCWYTLGVTLTGVDINFRPYFQIAMRGEQNVYAAIGTTTGQRALYFAAPLYAEVSSGSPLIGVSVARLNPERIDSALQAWTGPALLLSPQEVTFASNHSEWIERLAGEKTPAELQAIRTLKQFGHSFEAGDTKLLPFDIRAEAVSFADHRYAVARAPVLWNDPHGEWTLVLLGDLDDLLPATRRYEIGALSAALVMTLSAFFLAWRRRLQQANGRRLQAEAKLRAYTSKLESDSEAKSYLASLSAELHQTDTLAEFAHSFMRQVTPRLGADYGAFYLLDEESQLLTAVGAHAALPQELPAIRVGQGLVGQCATDMKTLYISEASANDIRIVWGGGQVAARFVLLAPISQDKRLLGVIVLAGLQPMGAEQRTLLEEMLPMVAMNLEILKRNLGTQHQAQILQQQQAHLQETEAWYRSLIESAPDGMLVVDEQGVIVLANRQIDAMFGYAAGELLDQNIDVLVPAAVRGQHPQQRQNYTLSGSARAMGTLNKSLHGVRQDGSEFPVEVGLSRLPALQGRGICVCASVRESSRNEQNQAAGLSRANEAD